MVFPYSRNYISIFQPNSIYYTYNSSNSMHNKNNSEKVVHKPGKVQQSTSESKPSETGQLFDPQKRPSWHSSWASQSPSFSEQVLQLQNPTSPLLAVAQLTKERLLPIEFKF